MAIAAATNVEAPSYERLHAQDASFLYFDRAETPMHVAVVAILEMESLATADGGVDSERLAKYIESRLPQLPRYRRRILQAPADGLPVWVDAETFRLERHIKRVAAPRPGDASSLKEIVGWILSQPLDHSQPLWEMWIVEGLERSHFALVSKVHHCMVDGASGVNLLTLLMSSTPDSGPPALPPAWTPRPAPGALRLLKDEWLRRTSLPLKAASRLRTALRHPRSALHDLFESGAGLAQAAGLRRPVSTPINRPIGPYRRVEWHMVDLESVKAVKNQLGGTVNDEGR